MNTISKLTLGLLLLLSLTKLTAQINISGKVTDINNEPLPFANVLIKGKLKGATTDNNGNFTLNNVKKKDILKVSMLGFKNFTVPISKTVFFKIVLREDSQILEEVVVTGVAVGTPVKKLPFALSKVNNRELKEVPGRDLGNSLRGKVAGITIVQPNGDPNAVSSIRLRGSNSLLRSQEPLIIIDGIITGSDMNLKDINMEDVESVEIIKGAAGSSMYGSLSGNGVIQIITKRGKNSGGKPTIVVRNETGFSQIAKAYPLANTHRYKLRDANDFPWNLNDLNEQGRWHLSNGGIRDYDEDGLLDNPFPRILDHQKKIYTTQPYSSLYTSISSGNENFKYHASFQNTKNGGAIQGVKPSVRNNARLNIDYLPNDKIAIKTSVSYAKTKGHNAPFSTRETALFLEPWVDITERDLNGDIVPTPKGSYYLRNFLDNPLYEVGILEDYFDRQRLMFSPSITYDINDNLQLGASYSHDESRSETYSYTPKEYKFPDPTLTNVGDYGIVSNISKSDIVQLYASYAKKIGNFNTRFTAKFLRENRNVNSFNAKGFQLLVSGVRNLSYTEGSSRIIGSIQSEEKVSNYFFDFNLDYKDKIIFNGLIRKDGSSLFGKDNRWATFGRLSAAYIVTKDFNIPKVDDLKLRFSWGTSGQRPAFNTQYETYRSTWRGTLRPDISGNKNLLPSRVSEWEAGINARLFDRVNLEVNYAKTQVKDDFLKVPLPRATGFKEQWQNLGSIASSALEVQLGLDIIKNKNFSWNANLNWSKITQEITDLGGVEPFSRSSRLFRVEEGKPYGLMYGYKVATNVNELTLDNNGFVINSLGNPNINERGTLKPEDFEINEHGYVIIKGTKGSAKEQVILLSDETGEDEKMEIGNTNPDWNLGFTSNFSYKNFNLYFVIDHQQGGDIYNSTKQRLYRAERHGDQEKFAKQGKHILYSGISSNLDRGLSDTSHFVEDGTFTKVRELSLGYTLGKNVLGPKASKIIKELKISLIGRNLFTFTNYSGFDPEVAYGSGLPEGSLTAKVSNPTNDRLDLRSYPQSRTFTAMVQLTF
ncbi:SusC/RagA family TonB-linked outer membrane protein [Aquimarina sp. I32.4]|uniref:SusC/RagA family TonB-linked outer membrane protein n=1 Tax=Aquimarina sp. I32.4 TaxID=2053903 RepID=UPI000CDED677|nr:SusC/RagA family TonB-linked outer membrane protein [Aquimarina sp. I32.4]